MAYIIKNFHKDIHGIALTEFILVVPVFIIMFAGIVELYRLENNAVIEAAAHHKPTLANFKHIQTTFNPIDASVNPVTGAIEAVAFLSRKDNVLNGALDGPGAAGHMFESRIKMETALPGAAFFIPTAAGDDLDQLYTTMGGLMNDTEAVMAPDLLNDMLNPLAAKSGAKGAWGTINKVLTVAGARPALAAGMRYGIAKGSSGKRFSHIAAPPRPTPRLATVAVVRGRLADDPAYDDSMLKFATKVDSSANIDIDTANKLTTADECLAETQKLEEMILRDDKDELEDYAKDYEENSTCPGLTDPANSTDTFFDDVISSF